MKKLPLTIVVLLLNSLTLCFSQNKDEEFPKRIKQNVQIKNREIDTEAKNVEVVFRKMEHYVFDEDGNELLYEDLSSRDGFPVFSERDLNTIEFKINDARRISTYDKMGNKTSCIIERYGNDPVQWQREYDKNGRIIHEINEKGNESWFVYDNAGHTISEKKRFHWSKKYIDEIKRKYNRDGKLISEIEKSGNDIKSSKTYKYDKNGHPVKKTYKNDSGEVFEYYSDGELFLEVKYGINFNWYDTEGRQVHCQTKEDGILKCESFYEYDEFGKEKSSKTCNYDEYGNITRAYELITERDSEGRVIHEKSYDTNDSSLDNYEKWFEFDSYGNQIFYKCSRKDSEDIIIKCEYKYDDKGNVTFYKDSEKTKWVVYDEQFFPTYLKLKSTQAGGYVSIDKRFYTEFFFINKYTFHENGKVKECMRYYFENPNYHQYGDYSLVLERQPDAGE